MGACYPHSVLLWLRRQPHSELRSKKADLISVRGDLSLQRLSWHKGRGRKAPWGKCGSVFSFIHLLFMALGT